MKIIIFSINPIFPDVITGGASKHLFHIARHLGRRRHAVEIYCAQVDTSQEVFSWAENVRVFPVLPFDLPFPQPYAISGPDLALITERLRHGLNDADRFYIHDGEWLIPDIYADLPTVSSFRDNIYPESVLGSFVTKADEVICVSPYSASIIEQTAGRFFPDLKNRIHQVNNGIDFKQFFPSNPETLAQDLGLDPERDVILLHPHRPEPGKGLSETVRLAESLVHKQGLSNIKILVPEWIDGMVSSGEKTYHNQMLQLMKELGVNDHFQFIPWLPNERMPELYSLGMVTLCLGNIVEAFGNVAYESLACGTPSIVARVGVHRTLMPDDLIAKVHYGDTNSAVDHVLQIMENGSQVCQETLRFMHDHMDFEEQINSYVRIIENCEKRKNLAFSVSKSGEDQSYQLAPWCYFDGNRIFHDFRGTFEPAPDLVRLFEKRSAINRTLAFRSGISERKWKAWLDRTFIVAEP
ncbi:MAG: glycosyltransferase family 4 protein [Brevefilum sp.]